MVALGPRKSLLDLETWQVLGRARPLLFTYGAEERFGGKVSVQLLAILLIGNTAYWLDN